MRLGDRVRAMCNLPCPTIAVLKNTCNNYLKWGGIWERMFETRAFAVDAPGSRAIREMTNPDLTAWENDRRCVEYQLKERITLCEEITARQFDVDKMLETMKLTNAMSVAWKRVIEVNETTPATLNALNKGTIFLGVANAMRGTRAGAKYFQDLLEELEYKAAHGIGTLLQEQYRLTFVGVPCYPILRRS